MSPPNRGRTKAMVLLDYVGNRGLRLLREGTSSEVLWDRLLVAANEADADGQLAEGQRLASEHVHHRR